MPSPIRPPRRDTVLVSLAFFLTVLGCAAAGTLPPEKDPLAGAPHWVTRGCRAETQVDATRPKVFCAVGSARHAANPIATEQTAIARARTAIARSIQVSIESLVRIENDHPENSDGELRSIIHQLTSTSLPPARVESTWQSIEGEFFALVSLSLNRDRESLRQSLRQSKERPPEPSPTSGEAQRTKSVMPEVQR